MCRVSSHRVGLDKAQYERKSLSAFTGSRPGSRRKPGVDVSEPTMGFCAAIGESAGFSAAHVGIRNGSDNILDLITRCFAQNPEQGTLCRTFPLPGCSRDVGTALEVPFDRSVQLDGGDPRSSNGLFLTNPNAPRGGNVEEIEQVLQAIDGLLVVDEAYVDFGGRAPCRCSKSMKTSLWCALSRSYSLAGMRSAMPLLRLRLLDCSTVCGMPIALTALRKLPPWLLSLTVITSRLFTLRSSQRRTRSTERLDWFTYPHAISFYEPCRRGAD